jgi:hypothetical protein
MDKDKAIDDSLLASYRLNDILKLDLIVVNNKNHTDRSDFNHNKLEIVGTNKLYINTRWNPGQDRDTSDTNREEGQEVYLVDSYRSKGYEQS